MPLAHDTVVQGRDHGNASLLERHGRDPGSVRAGTACMYIPASTSTGIEQRYCAIPQRNTSFLVRVCL